jgi:hypothetical protein
VSRRDARRTCTVCTLHIDIYVACTGAREVRDSSTHAVCCMLPAQGRFPHLHLTGSRAFQLVRQQISDTAGAASWLEWLLRRSQEQWAPKACMTPMCWQEQHVCTATTTANHIATICLLTVLRDSASYALQYTMSAGAIHLASKFPSRAVWRWHICSTASDSGSLTVDRQHVQCPCQGPLHCRDFR